MLRIATWNINGLTPNKDEVELLLKEQNLDILLVSEAHCTSRTYITFKHYKCYLTNHPDGTGHAGTAIIVKNTIKHYQMPGYQTQHIQATTISVQDNTGLLNVSAAYCPPRHKVSEQMWSHFFNTLGSRFVVGGDWNCKHTYWGSRLITTRGRQLLLSMQQNHLSAVSAAEPTYWPSDPNKIPDLLDFFIIKGLTRQYLKPEPCYDGSSDHTPVVLSISTMVIENSKLESLYNKYTDWQGFSEFVEKNIKLNVALKTPDNIETATKYFTRLIQEACWINTPTIEHKVKHSNFPAEIKAAIREKRKLRRIWHQTRCSNDKRLFNRATTKLKQKLKDWRNITLEAQLESLTATAATNYSLWKFTKEYDRPQPAKPPLKMDHGWARTPQEKAEAFGRHLAGVFCPNPRTDADKEIDQILGQDYQMSLPPDPITVKEVWRIIHTLQDKKAPGFDLLTKEILLHLPKQAVVFLTTLYNGILRVQYYPYLWKVSQVTMIPKVGKALHEITSYRPISLLPVLSKVFEKLLLNRLLPLLEAKNVIPLHQFGFRQHHSTTEQVHRVCDEIRHALENKQYCAAAFLDVQQAFDRVWHKGLLCKIKTSLPHSYHLLCASYLSGRLFQVKENGSTSKFYDINAGVPQGSVLGPVLYTVYTADLPETDGITIATFADDTALLARNESPIVASQILQSGLDKITSWLRKWRVKASTSKSTQVTFTLRKENCPPVKLDGSTLPHQNSVKYLGVHLDRRLTWVKHIKTKREELNLRYKTLHWILGQRSVLSIDNKLLIYKVILKSIWMYCCQLWGSASNSNVSILQRMQNTILRSIANVPWYITNAEIHEHLGMKTVKEEVSNVTKKYLWKLQRHPNELAVQLTTPSYQRRLKRNEILKI